MIVVNSSYCPQNHRCPSLRVCPTGALQQEGFSAPTVDKELCIECGRCTFSCPVFSQVPDEPTNGKNGHSQPGDGAAAEAPDDNLRWFGRGGRH